MEPIQCTYDKANYVPISTFLVNIITRNWQISSPWVRVLSSSSHSVFSNLKFFYFSNFFHNMTLLDGESSFDMTSVFDLGSFSDVWFNAEMALIFVASNRWNFTLEFHPTWFNDFNGRSNANRQILINLTCTEKKQTAIDWLCCQYWIRPNIAVSIRRGFEILSANS